ncbi:MAG: hypothetical protein CMP12_05490 [Zunongwangia sp.]|jgi:hypothetical protein|uniref:Uncharacterized protein n=2 Tax=Zunongwangia profunda TaxID=398743 RepID=D5BG63_ZUNPS|nr:hypothetical protein [Zunongwangia profunda]MAC63907.1 hypothetical protein [Flavobacteriaceae bacterium]MAO35356.1 hypothetical protein [Zunongwangia sp.]ADF53176.1 conserved hypothetical protein [Zunongwangia profunda SM-A87]MAS69461.1 hypothetical protein [Zunongwangia sp.]MCC4229360.1 hypothetical protein [Zunongwangia profunda]|tara:strand:+ start:435 stop:686 length:252 start_codon:yes stop_codon:yes gene_type:complete
MKLPVIKHLQKNNEADKLQATVDVLESFTEHRSVSEEEMDVIGELITNICGAIEVHRMVSEEGMKNTDAANAFVKKVLGSIDQ